jgi:arsenical resistance protein ArsH
MTLPNVDMNLLDQPTLEKVQAKELDHPPRILLLYGSNRERSYSRLAVMEAGRILEHFGAEVKIFHPKGLPLPEDADTEHPKVKELHDLLAWAEGMVWCSPERHGSMSSIFKSQIDWIPLAGGAIRATQGKTLALMQVSGGSQSFNSLNQMRILGRWMRMITIPNQSSIPKASLLFFIVIIKITPSLLNRLGVFHTIFKRLNEPFNCSIDQDTFRHPKLPYSLSLPK